MKNRIMLIYQDCPMCGNRKEWGEVQLRIADGAGIEIEKISFASKRAEGLAKKAVEAGIPSYPFFTDGERFGKDISLFCDNSGKKTKKGAKK